MKKEEKTKSIVTDIVLTIWTRQLFEVPLDYVIKEATPKEAYEKLINEFGNQNVNAIKEPSEIETSDYCGIELDFIGDEFIIASPGEKAVQVKRFESPKSKKGRR